MERIRVAVCQTLCIDSDPSGNFARIENALKKVCDLKAQIACFPEMCILGWANPEAYQLAHPIPGPYTDRLSELARQYGMMLSVGLVEKECERLYDSAVLIDHDGTLLLKHRKMNILSELMTPPYAPGSDVRAVDTRFGRVGMLICADTFVSRHLERMREQHPDVLIVPYGWAAPKEKWPEHGKSLSYTVSKAARAVGAPVVGVDLVGLITHGPWSGRTYGGRSVVCDATGALLATGLDRDVDVFVVELG